MTKKEFDKKAKNATAIARKAQDNILAKKRLTELQTKMLLICASHGFEKGGKVAVRQGLIK